MALGNTCGAYSQLKFWSLTVENVGLPSISTQLVFLELCIRGFLPHTQLLIQYTELIETWKLALSSYDERFVNPCLLTFSPGSCLAMYVLCMRLSLLSRKQSSFSSPIGSKY